jgi:hypothetical protein
VKVGLHFTLPIEFLKLRANVVESGVGMHLCSNTWHRVKNWTADTVLIQHHLLNPPEITAQESRNSYMNKHRTNSVSEPINKHLVELLFQQTSTFDTYSLLSARLTKPGTQNCISDTNKIAT